jgi:hypothetical protein
MSGERSAGGSMFKVINGSLTPPLRTKTDLAAKALGLHPEQHVLALQVAVLGEDDLLPRFK